MLKPFHPFGTGKHNFGYIPPAPEYDCSGDFDEDDCKFCCYYDQCKDAEYIDVWEKLAEESEDEE